jgi:mycoredoxin-dependent peroxiredoxin
MTVDSDVQEVTVGSLAPDFTLPSTSGDPVTLSALRGQKVVLMFYPYAFTGVCTGEVCALSDDLASFAELDAQVLSVSCDALPTLKKFAAEENLTYPLLSDFWPHGKVARSYGVFLEDLGAANRGTFILDRDGVVAWSTVTSLGEARDAAQYREVLAGLA